MNAFHSKSILVYGKLRRSLRSGCYRPGQWIDPVTIAAELKTSPTPVRAALYRLVGEGLIADHARHGLHVPLLNDVATLDLYDWMGRLMLMACDIGVSPSARRIGKLEFGATENDLVKHTWQLFDLIAHATAQRFLHEAVTRANDRLAPIRRAKEGFFKDAYEELSQLNGYWQTRDMPALKCALHHYHERRKKAVHSIVDLVSEGHDYLH